MLRFAYFFMTCRFTLVMSTFWLNSGGNFVLLRSFASTPVAMMGNLSSLVFRAVTLAVMFLGEK